MSRPVRRHARSQCVNVRIFGIGCLVSIAISVVLSVVLTVVLNLVL